MAQALAFALWLALAAGCRFDRTEQQLSPTQEARGFTLSRSRGGLAEWRLKSPKANFDETASRAKVVAPVIDLYKKGKPETRAEAEHGEIDLGSQDMLLKGSVKVDNSVDKTSLRTDELRYFSKEKEFRTDRPVEIRRPEGTMRGRGMTASHDLSLIRVHKQETRLQ